MLARARPDSAVRGGASLEQAGYTIASAEPLATLDDLHDLARTAGITIPTPITTAS